MNNKLLEIVNYKKEYVKRLPRIELKRNKAILDPRKFLLNNPIIAEFKKASPSAGIINDGISLEERVLEYQRSGAGMVSVLTDEKFFGGSFEYLSKASQILSIPTLCKDFIISEIQIDYAYSCGADAVLLIAAILDDKLLHQLVYYAKKLSLNILLEIHTELEYERVKDLSVEMIGVNSRNLDTFQIDKNNAAMIISKVKHDFVVAESGIEDENDLKMFKIAGAKGFLIGTSLMRSKNLADTFTKLYRGLKDVY